MTTQEIQETQVTEWPLRELHAVLKAAVKEDCETIRRRKRAMRAEPQHHAMNQSSLASERKFARARQIIYGYSRGHAWGRMERNHPNGDAQLAYAIKVAWTSIRGSLKAKVEMPKALQDMLESFK